MKQKDLTSQLASAMRVLPLMSNVCVHGPTNEPTNVSHKLLMPLMRFFQFADQPTSATSYKVSQPRLRPPTREARDNNARSACPGPLSLRRALGVTVRRRRFLLLFGLLCFLLLLFSLSESFSFSFSFSFLSLFPALGLGLGAAGFTCAAKYAM